MYPSFSERLSFFLKAILIPYALFFLLGFAIIRLEHEFAFINFFSLYMLTYVGTSVAVLAGYALIFTFMSHGMEQVLQLKWLIGFYVLPLIMIIISFIAELQDPIAEESLSRPTP